MLIAMKQTKAVIRINLTMIFTSFFAPLIDSPMGTMIYGQALKVSTRKPEGIQRSIFHAELETDRLANPSQKKTLWVSLQIAMTASFWGHCQWIPSSEYATHMWCGLLSPPSRRVVRLTRQPSPPSFQFCFVLN